MENTYGIGIANRYDLFYGQDDVTDFETVVSKKKKEKKEPAAPGQPQPAAPKSVAEKENKAQPKTNNAAAPQKAQSQDARKDQRKGIKEQNNTGKKDDNRQITQNGQPRQQFAQKPGENREERNNRKNREMNGPLTNGMEQSDKPRGNNNPNKVRNDRKNFNGKRRDRQSGSDKTGVKPVDKRGGEGAHNWGTHKQDIEDMNKPVTDGEETSGEKEGEEVEEQPPAPEEPKEMTLDEWKAQRQAQMLQPQYNIRKAGEGEDNGKWADNMVKLDRKVEDNAALKKEADAKKEAETKKKQLLDIEFHFNDGRRGGLGRRGPATGERGDRGGDRGGERRQNRRRPPRENGEGGAPAPAAAAATAAAAPGPSNEGGDGQRRQRRPRFQRGEGPNGQNAPKVDDIRAFPSLS